MKNLAILLCLLGIVTTQVYSQRNKQTANNAIVENIKSKQLFPKTAEEPNKVFIHYMGWFGSGISGRHWNDGQQRTPLIGYYDSRSWATQTYHILLSWSCGIDGIVINIKDSYDEQSLKVLISTLKSIRSIDSVNFKYDFSISYDDQGMDNINTAKDKFTYLRDTILPYTQNYLKYNNIPVIFIWNYKDPNPYLSATDYNTALNTVFPTNKPKVLWNEIEAPEIANSYYPWVQGFASDGSNWGKDYLDWYYPTIANTPNLDFATGGVWAGFNDTLCNWGKHHWIDRHNGAIYDTTWSYINTYSITYPPSSYLPLRWAYIETWNDWNEGSEIEPSKEYGYKYLKSTITNINTFKGTSVSLDTSKFEATKKIYEASKKIELKQCDSLINYPILKRAIQSFFWNNYSDAISKADSILNEIVPLKWINFSPYTKLGQNPNIRSNIPETQIVSLLDSIKPWVKGIRTFGTKNGLEKIPQLAKQRGLKVIVGIWLGTNLTDNNDQISQGISIANAGYADRIIVGSEVLLRNELSASKIVEYLNFVKQACPNIPISYADVASNLINHPEIVAACDFVYPNIYPFWEGIPIECALQYFDQTYLSLKSKYPSKEILISESGWKTNGPLVKDAEPSLKNAIRYNHELLVWSKAFGIEVNLFSAFDEPWKLPNDDGWGIFTNVGSLKPGMDTLFTPITKIDTTWLCHEISNLNADTLSIDFIPPIESFLDLKGHINHFKPCDYVITAYIKVAGAWWIKPTSGAPTVPVRCDGSWNIDITTGGIDHKATDICVFLIPSTYSPPIALGYGSIPSSIFQNAINYKYIRRCSLPYDTISSSLTKTCPNQKVILSTNRGKSQLWSTKDTSASIEVYPDKTTKYFVMVTASSGCVETRSKVITVYPTYYNNINKSICQGSSIQIGDSVITEAGFYKLLLSSHFGCDSIVALTLNVDTIPTITSTTPGSRCGSGTVTLSATASAGQINWYSASTGGPSLGTGTSFTTPSLSETKTYYVNATNNGCTTATRTPITATINVCPGIDEIVDDKGISIYPNPTSGNIKIVINNKFDSDYVVEVYDKTGSLLQTLKKKRSITDFDINLRELSAGVYLIRIYSTNRNYQTKVIKE